MKLDYRNIRVNLEHDALLSELSAKRKQERNFIRSKQDIVGDLIIKAHKKECLK